VAQQPISLQILVLGDSHESAAVILCLDDVETEGCTMRPRERRETGEGDLFRSRLDQIIDMKHALVKLVQASVAFRRR